MLSTSKELELLEDGTAPFEEVEVLAIILANGVSLLGVVVWFLLSQRRALVLSVAVSAGLLSL